MRASLGRALGVKSDAVFIVSVLELASGAVTLLDADDPVNAAGRGANVTLDDVIAAVNGGGGGSISAAGARRARALQLRGRARRLGLGLLPVDAPRAGIGGGNESGVSLGFNVITAKAAGAAALSQQALALSTDPAALASALAPALAEVAAAQGLPNGTLPSVALPPGSVSVVQLVFTRTWWRYLTELLAYVWANAGAISGIALACAAVAAAVAFGVRRARRAKRAKVAPAAADEDVLAKAPAASPSAFASEADAGAAAASLASAAAAAAAADDPEGQGGSTPTPTAALSSPWRSEGELAADEDEEDLSFVPWPAEELRPRIKGLGARVKGLALPSLSLRRIAPAPLPAPERGAGGARVLPTPPTLDEAALDELVASAGLDAASKGKLAAALAGASAAKRVRDTASLGARARQPGSAVRAALHPSSLGRGGKK